MSNLSKAIAIASKAFENRYDKGGKPYILHCLHVMYGVEKHGEVGQICAVLHDLVEDCEKDGYDFDFLVKEGFSIEVIHILKFLTHNKETPYMDYIKALATNEIARAIKMADIQHNSQVTRLKSLTKKNLDKLHLYFQAHEYLKQV